MKRGRLGGLAALCALAFAPVAGAVAPTETVRLAALGGSSVRGVASVGSNRRGTAIVVRLAGLPPGRFRVILQAGNCSRRSASFTQIFSGTSATGRFRARGTILFHGMPVDYGTIADGAHVIVVVGAARTLACGVVPGMS